MFGKYDILTKLLKHSSTEHWKLNSNATLKILKEKWVKPQEIEISETKPKTVNGKKEGKARSLTGLNKL